MGKEIAKKEEDENAEGRKELLKIQQAKKSRLIVRNLVFDINEKHLKNIFHKYGPITDIQVPKNPVNNQSKGFAFVQYANKNEAMKAIKELNNTLYKGRRMLIDFSIDKTNYVKAKNAQNHNEDANESNELKEEIEEKEEEIEEEAEQVEEENEEVEEEEVEEEENDAKASRKSSTKSKTHEKTEKEKKEDLKPTLFIKNIPFDTTEEEFKQFFETFGELVYAKLVISKETGSSRGTGFVKFKSAETSKSLLDNYDELDLDLNGRKLDIKPALERNQVESQLKEDKTKKPKVDIKKLRTIEEIVGTDPNNKRRLGMALEGNYKEQEIFTPNENERRAKHLLEKIDKLKNPNSIVSDVRVLFKHLPKKGFTETDLKELINNYFTNDQKLNLKKKFVKNVKLFFESEKKDKEGNLKSKGFAVVVFKKPEYALEFVRYSCSPEFSSNFPATIFPIVEFAIENAMKLQKIERIQEAQKSKTSKQNENKEEIDAEKKKKLNSSSLSRVKLNQYLERARKGENIKSFKDDIVEHMNKLYSRGSKQRTRKNFIPFIPSLANSRKNDKNKSKLRESYAKDQANQDNQARNSTKSSVKNKNQKNSPISELQSKIKEIRNDVKANMKRKRKLQEFDEIDDIENAHLKKSFKKVKIAAKTD